MTASSAPTAPRPAWYAACASQRLGRDPLAVQVLENPIALWRDGEGVARAVQDRCAHRGARLSLGGVTDGHIACRYHGWRFGADGACRHIPSLVEGQSIPKGVGVTGHPCAEADGYVWVWIGEGPPSGAPQVEDFARFNWMQGSTLLRCSALAAIENNLDWCHPVFTHPFTHGQFFLNQAMGFTEQAVEMRLTKTGVTVFTPPTASADEPLPEAPFVALTFTLPDRVSVAFSAGPNGPMRIVLHLVPLGENLCRQEWMVSTGPSDGAPAVGWSDNLPTIFDQDRQVLESVQEAVDREGRGFERSVAADAPTLLARRIYGLASRGVWPRGAKALTRRRILQVRA